MEWLPRALVIIAAACAAGCGGSAGNDSATSAATPTAVPPPSPTATPPPAPPAPPETPPANAAPVARLTAQPTSGLAPLTVALDGSASSDADGRITSYAWILDGTTLATGAATHRDFHDAGRYTVTLAVTDDGGATGTATATIDVRPVFAAKRYAVEFLPSDDDSTARTPRPAAVNDAGEIVGTLEADPSVLVARPEPRAFLHSGGITRALGAAGSASVATDIDQRGRVVGTTWTDAGDARAFVYRDGAMTELGTLGGNASRAESINTDGWVVGGAATADGTQRAFVHADGTMTDLGTLGGNASLACGIGGSGDVVGSANTPQGTQHAFAFRDGAMTDLGTLGGENSAAVNVNDHGDVAGWSEVVDATGARHEIGFLYRDGRFTEIRAAPGQDVWPYAVNDLGQVVGAVLSEREFDYGFVWHPSNGLRNLNELVDAPPGCRILRADDINDAGRIVALARCTTAGDDGTETTRGVVLRPVE